MRLHGIDGNKVRFFAFYDHTASFSSSGGILFVAMEMI